MAASQQFLSWSSSGTSHASIPDLFDVFINFGNLQSLFFARTRRHTQVFGDWLSVSYFVMPSQTQVYAVCSCIGAANYLLSREFQSGRPPNFPVSTPSLQPGMCRVLSSCCQGQGKHWPNTWKLRNLPTEKIINFVSIIIIKAFFLFRILFYTRILIKIGFNRCIYRHSVTGSKTLLI